MYILKYILIYIYINTYLYIYIHVIYVHLLVQIINNKKSQYCNNGCIYKISTKHINTFCRKNLKLYIKIYFNIYIKIYFNIYIHTFNICAFVGTNNKYKKANIVIMSVFRRSVQNT